MSVLRVLAQYTANLKLEDIPPVVVRNTKYCVLDSMGASIGASRYEEIPSIVEEILNMSSNECKNGACVWGYNRKTSVFQAALLNGIMAHALELDDVHTKSKTHIGAVVLPTAWTLAETLGSSGKEFLEAVLAGYEAMARVGAGFGVSSHRLKGWHSTGTAGTFGAAAAAARLLKLDVEKTLSAFGMAGTQSSGLWAFLEDGASSKKMHTGRAAENGIVAAFLAKAGMTGPEHILEAKDGGLYQATSDEFDLSLVTKNLGKKYEIIHMDKKLYPSCRSTHPAIDAIIRIKQRLSLKSQEIKDISVHTYEVGVKQCGSSKYPQNALEGKFSIPYTVAVALIDGEVTLEQFKPAKFLEPRIEELADKVSVYADKRFTNRYPAQWGCLITINMKDDTIIKEEVTNTLGSVINPLSEEQEINKFLLLVTPILGQKKTQNILDTIVNMEHYPSIPEI